MNQARLLFIQLNSVFFQKRLFKTNEEIPYSLSFFSIILLGPSKKEGEKFKKFRNLVEVIMITNSDNKITSYRCGVKLTIQTFYPLVADWISSMSEP